MLLNLIKDLLNESDIFLGVNEIDALNFEQKSLEIRNFILSSNKKKDTNFLIYSFADVVKGICDFAIKQKNTIFSREDLSKINIKTDEEVQQSLFLLKERLEECKNISK